MATKDCTGERLAKIETSLEYLKEKMESIDKKQDDFIKSADSKYASKLTERLVYSMAALMLTAIIVAIIRQVIIG